MACKTKSGNNDDVKLTEEQEKILTIMATQEGPVTSKEISEATGIATKFLSCRIQSLKKKGLVESPARCKYEITGAGKVTIAHCE